MMALGRRLGFEGAALTELGLAGLLHDIGKVGVPDATLNKPGKLDALEWASVRQHPEMGWDILRRESAAGPVALDVCLHHHEKTDGTGYPHKLGGDAISRAARMGAICDVYDAITSDRPYKRGWEPAEAIRRMAEWQEGHFDRTIFHAFVKLVGIYPTGWPWYSAKAREVRSRPPCGSSARYRTVPRSIRTSCHWTMARIRSSASKIPRNGASRCSSCCGRERSTGLGDHSPSSIARTFRPSSSIVNGLPSSSTSGSSTPWWTTALRV
jgi:hypothetical protein